MKLIKNTLKLISRAQEISARHAVRNHLMALDDRTLRDVGFDRQLLQQGVRAWPWRAPAEVIELTQSSKKHTPGFYKAA